MGKAMGARVIGVDLADERLELARKLGVDEILNPNKADPVSTIRDLTGGMGADAAFETSGSANAHRALIDALRPGAEGCSSA